MENIIEVLKKLKTELPEQSHCLTYSQKNLNQGLKNYLQPSINFHIIYHCQIWKQLKSASIKNRYRKYCIYIQWNIINLTKEGNLVFCKKKKKKTYIQEIMLSEINQSQKDKHYVISLLSVSKTVKLLVAENGRVFSRGWEEGGMYSFWMYIRFQVSQTSSRGLLYTIVPVVNSIVHSKICKENVAYVKHSYLKKGEKNAKGLKKIFGDDSYVVSWFWWWYHDCIHICKLIKIYLLKVFVSLCFNKAKK